MHYKFDTVATAGAGLALRRSSHSLTSAYSAGITASVSTVEDTMAPTIGAAMRLIASAPVPVLHEADALIDFYEALAYER
jgi:hypothetical protein